MKTSTRRRCRPLLLTASAFGIAMLCAGAAQAWISAASTVQPSGSFLVVQLPGEPITSQGLRETVLGDIEYETISSNPGDATLTIMSSTLPNAVTAMASTSMLLRAVRDEMLQDQPLETMTWEHCHHTNHPCRELRYALADGRRGRARFFIEDDAMVVLDTVYRTDEAIAEQFLASAR